jgi:hypothetical protein
MNVNGKLDKLLTEARGLRQRQERLNQQTAAAGLPWDAVKEAVVNAVADEDEDLFAEVLDQIQEYDAHEAALPEGERHSHGLMRFMALVMAGASSLPVPLPRRWLEAWRNGYRDHPCNTHPASRPGTPGYRPATPIPLYRCADCLLALPNSFGHTWRECPSCGGTRFQVKNLANDNHPHAWHEAGRKAHDDSP